MGRGDDPPRSNVSLYPSPPWAGCTWDIFAVDPVFPDFFVPQKSRDQKSQIKGFSERAKIMAEITTTTAHLNQVIDEILNEITGDKTPSQMLLENKANPSLNPQYGLLAHPPSYSPSVQMLKGLIKEEVSKIKFGKHVGDKINQLAFQSGVANEFKHKVNELSRRLKMNGFSGYDYYEIATDKQQDIFGMNLTPQGFPEALLSVEDWVDSLAVLQHQKYPNEDLDDESDEEDGKKGGKPRQVGRGEDLPL